MYSAGWATSWGEFNTPSAIERVGDHFLVLDKALGEITLFQTTEYGRTLNEAVRSYYRGDEAAALALFQKSINMNANLEFAYAGNRQSAASPRRIRRGDEIFQAKQGSAELFQGIPALSQGSAARIFPWIMTGIVYDRARYDCVQEAPAMERGKKTCRN